MRTWKRAPVELYCGSCPAHIHAGEAYLELHFQFLRGPMVRKVRCQQCADADAPVLPEPEMKATVTPTAKPKRLIAPRLASVRDLAHDWKVKQIGPEREPREDG